MKNDLNIYYENKEYNFTLIKDNSLELLKKLDKKTINIIFADPPYFLSDNGITCKSGKISCVNKGDWDTYKSYDDIYNFNYIWLKEAKELLDDNGTLWVSGTMHNIFTIGHILHLLNYKILNDIIWFKRNAPPNMCCRYFTHSTETLIWAAKSNNSKHTFNYEELKKINNNKQMRNLFDIPLTPPKEKTLGKHPTQKPLDLLKLILIASSNEGDVVLDPFCGSSTTGLACVMLKRKYIGIDINDEYLELSKKRFIDFINNKSVDKKNIL